MLDIVIDRRYRLRSKLGSGDRSDVYAAVDLERSIEVAVKVFHQYLASDPSFVQTFPIEIRAAAGLEHPNVLDICGWGREGELYYVVTEYIGGRDLGVILAEEPRIMPGKAAEMAAEVCDALEYAHRRQVVHGDIKPQNILVMDTGRVKVTDFGIGRAGAGGTSARYISPEQAQGMAADGRSDIYSLGIVLYQMLTGRVPFDGGDPNETAYRQVIEVPVPPSDLVPGLPQSLEAAVMRALAKDPELRFQGAAEMGAELRDFVRSSHGTSPAMPDGGTPREAKVKTGSTSRKWGWAAAVVIPLVVLGAILLVLLSGGVGKVEVPDLEGMSLEEARQTLEAQELKIGEVEISYMQDENQQAGVVVSQEPEAGEVLDRGEAVNVKVFEELRMPNVTGVDRDEAVSLLKKQGITVIEIVNATVEEEDEVGKVLSQEPAGGALITPDIEVSLEVGVEPEEVTVPDVVDLEREDAIGILEEAGLEVSVREVVSTETAEGRVIRQDPAAGQSVEEGTMVSIIVSSGPP